MNAQKTLAALAALTSCGHRQDALAQSIPPLDIFMKRNSSVSAAIVAAGLAIWPARAEAGVEAERPSVTLELGAGSTVMLARPFKSVLIGNPEVVDVQTQNERSILLKPLSLGTTNLIFIDYRGIVITNLTIMVRNART